MTNGHLTVPTKTDGETIESIKTKQGWVGKFFGSGEDAKINILGIVLCICLTFIGIMIIAYYRRDKNFENTSFSAIISLITGVIGYLMGKKE